MRTETCIFLLVKYPEKGKVKVRLAKQVGDEVVVQLYKNFVLDTLSTLDSSGISFILCFYPKVALMKFERWLGSRYEYIPQRGMNLGERLRNGFMDVFSTGFSRVIALASDSPDLPEKILLEACAALQTHDAVIGPSLDGGYYLIGFQQNTFFSDTFKGIRWSTKSVFNGTIDKLRKGKRSIHILPCWADIDTCEDLKNVAEKSKNPNFHSSSKTMKYLLHHTNIISKPNY